MRVLATISDMKRVALLLDLESGTIDTIPARPEFIDPTAEAPCRPFGITWSNDELYIANNRQLLVFDKHFNYNRTLATPLQVNTHQLAYHADRVWAVSPRTRSLIGVHPRSGLSAVEFRLYDDSLSQYIARDTSEAEDRYHFNSLLWADGYLFVAAHNFVHPSFIKRYDEGTLQTNQVMAHVGYSIHGLAYQNGELFWISTGTGELRSSHGYRKRLSRKGYARGLSMTRDHFIVAISEFLIRDQRRGGDSWIQVIDREEGKSISEVHLADTGSINDLRLLDQYDHAHWIPQFEGIS